MNREDIIRMASKSGVALYGMGLNKEQFFNYLERFSDLVTKAEREACLQIIESEAMQYDEPVWAFEIVNDIKARGHVATNNTSQKRVDKTSESVHEPVQWGVDWGRAGDSPCVSIIKRLPDGRIEVVAVEYGPQRTWVGLTDEEIKQMGLSNYIKVVRETEAKLKEKNT